MLALMAWLLGGAPDAGAASRYEDEQSVVVMSPSGVINVTIKPGFHLNDDYPITFKPDFAGPKVEKNQMEIAECAGHPKTHCAMKISVPMPQKGQTLGGTLAFAACDADTCLIKKVPLSVRVRR